MQGTGHRDQGTEKARVKTSALTGEGIAELREAILALVQSGPQSAETALLTNLRQQQAVQAALEGLAAAQTAITENIPHEMLLLDIYSALRGLDALTGETTADDVLNLIFSTFCIGK
jgi:tRNA modification GTPase